MALNVGAGSSGSYSAYGIQVKENQALYDKYLGAYKDVLSGVQSVGNAQRQALTDFYAQKQGQADQSLVSRGLGNTTVQDSINRGLTLDEGKAQNDLSEKVARMRADYESQMAQGIHAFMGGYSESASRSYPPMSGSSSASGGFGGFGATPGRVAYGGNGMAAGGPVYIGGSYGPAAGGIGGPSSVYVPQGGFAGEQGDFGQPFNPSGQVEGSGGYDEFGAPSGDSSGYDQSQYAWA